MKRKYPKRIMLNELIYNSIMNGLDIARDNGMKAEVGASIAADDLVITIQQYYRRRIR